MLRHKVLHLITHLDVGGAQDNTLLTVEGLDRSRFEVHLAGAGGRWVERARAGADRFFLLPSLQRKVFDLRHAAAFRDIYRLIRREQYHIVHTHSTHAGILGRIAAKLARVPVVIHTVHGFGFDDRTLSPHIRKLLILMERACARSCDGLVFVSKLNKQQALELRLAPAEKMRVIYSGIDLDRFQQQSDPAPPPILYDLNDASVVVGWVGRLCEQNAPEVFITAARRVLQDRPSVDFVMAGDGPQWEECRQLTEDVPNIHMLGHRGDVPKLLPHFDIFVSTVRWAGLGRAVTEAMIAGLPVVATSVNGVPEIVHHEETGFLVPPDDPTAVATTVCRLIDNPELATRVGTRAQERVVSVFNADKMVHRISMLYATLLVEKGLAVLPASGTVRLKSA